VLYYNKVPVRVLSSYESFTGQTVVQASALHHHTRPRWYSAERLTEDVPGELNRALVFTINEYNYDNNEL